MIDETTPPEVQDTAGTAAPEGTPANDGSEWQKRYDDLRPEYTRATQEAARLREEKEAAEQQAYAYQIYATTDDPDLKRQAAEALGLETEQAPQEDDPLSSLNARVEKFEKWQEEQTRVAAEQAENERIGTLIGERITALVNESGDEYSESEMKVLYGLALLETDEQGNPDPQAAWDLFHEVGKSRSQAILKGKRNVPKPSTGVDATGKKPDLSNDQARREHFAERVAALEQGT